MAGAKAAFFTELSRLSHARITVFVDMAWVFIYPTLYLVRWGRFHPS